MKWITIFILSVILLFQFSCKDKDDSEIQTFADIDIVTGLKFYDANASPLGKWRSPNNKPGNVRLYPNPSINELYVFSQEKINHFWLIPASCLKDEETEDIESLSQILTYNEEEVSQIALLDLSTPDFSMNLAIDISGVSTGFYRLFFQMANGELFWENLFINPTVTNFTDYGFLEDLCD